MYVQYALAKYHEFIHFLQFLSLRTQVVLFVSRKVYKSNYYNSAINQKSPGTYVIYKICILYTQVQFDNRLPSLRVYIFYFEKITTHRK